MACEKPCRVCYGVCLYLKGCQKEQWAQIFKLNHAEMNWEWGEVVIPRSVIQDWPDTTFLAPLYLWLIFIYIWLISYNSKWNNFSKLWLDTFFFLMSTNKIRSIIVSFPVTASVLRVVLFFLSLFLCPVAWIYLTQDLVNYFYLLL